MVVTQALEELGALCLKSWPRSKRPFLDFHYPLFCSREQRQSCTSVSDPSLLQTAVNQLEGSQFRLTVVPQQAQIGIRVCCIATTAPGRPLQATLLSRTQVHSPMAGSVEMLGDVRRVQRQPRLGHRLGSMRRNRTARQRALVFFGSISTCSI